MEYIALKFDIVGSRKLLQRESVQRTFLAVADEINERFGSGLAAEFIVTHGDEAQALLRTSHADFAFAIFEHLFFAIRAVEFRCGIGLGTLSTSLREKAIGMDGTAWQNAEAAIQCAKKKRQAIYFKGFAPHLETQLNALGNLLCFVRSRWTKEQIEVIRLLTKFSTQKEIAVNLGISEAAVSKRLTSAGWQYYYQGRRALDILLQVNTNA